MSDAIDFSVTLSGAVRLIADGQDYSGKDLVELAQRCVGTLAREGLTSGRVGVRLERSALHLAWLLACLSAGATYVPLDPTWSQDQIDAAAAAASLNAIADAEGLHQALRSPDWSTASTPAYIMFTSGSTAQPKGAVIGKSQLVALYRALGELSIEADDRLLWNGSVASDASLFEVLVAMRFGIPLVLRPSTDDLSARLRKTRATVVVLTPSVMSMLETPLPGVRAVMSVGELLGPDLARRWARHHTVFNLYGPAECAIWTTCHRVEVADLSDAPVSVGAPVGDNVVSIHDADGLDRGVGNVGEVVISGDQVGDGYCTESGVSTRAGGFGGDGARVPRCYATGDLGSIDEHGRLTIFGRLDRQVKRYGQRVDDAQIERILRSLDGVRDARVLRVGAGQSAWAFALMNDGYPNEAGTDLRVSPRSGVSADLMGIVPVEAWPLLPNGKIDDKALMALTEVSETGPADEASGDVLTRVLGILRDVLDGAPVEASSNFFAAGGNSLSAAVAMGRIRETFSTDYPLSLFFLAEDIGEFAEALRDWGSESETKR